MGWESMIVFLKTEHRGAEKYRVTISNILQDLYPVYSTPHRNDGAEACSFIM